MPRSVADLARRLPLERKVAQLFLVGFRGTDLAAEIFRRLRAARPRRDRVARHELHRLGAAGALAGEAPVIASESGTCRRG